MDGDERDSVEDQATDGAGDGLAPTPVELPPINRAPVSDRSNAAYAAATPGLPEPVERRRPAPGAGDDRGEGDPAAGERGGDARPAPSPSEEPSAVRRTPPASGARPAASAEPVEPAAAGAQAPAAPETAAQRFEASLEQRRASGRWLAVSALVVVGVGLIAFLVGGGFGLFG